MCMKRNPIKTWKVVYFLVNANGRYTWFFHRKIKVVIFIKSYIADDTKDTIPKLFKVLLHLYSL